jgi:hypothetical protein
MNIEAEISQDECESLVRKLSALRKDIGAVPKSFFPDEPVKGPFYFDCERFDINRFLEVFDRVKLHEGYLLDYFYHADEYEGYPIPFTREEASDPFLMLKDLTWQVYKMEYPEYPNLVKHIQFEKTSSGYFQFAVFSEVVYHFYLFWHALYKESEVILTKFQLDQLADTIGKNGDRPLSVEAISALNKVSLSPHVLVAGDSADVTLVVFSKFRGFFKERVRVHWPNEIKAIGGKLIVKYDCGYIY